MKNDLLVFCENLLYLRKKHKLTQRQMAEKLGVSVRSIRFMEHGILPVRTTIDVIYRAYLEFRISPEELFHPLYKKQQEL